jgi:transcription-repair coupling factor (superfamily II helicase)
MTTEVINHQIDSTQLDIDYMRFEEFPEEVIQEKEKQIALYRKMLDCIQNKPLSSLRKEICTAFGIEQEVMFKHTRKRAVVNARQVYTYLLMTTDIKNQRILPIEELLHQKYNPDMDKRDSPSFMGRHLDFNHATTYNSLRTTWNYYQTEKFYKDLIDRLQKLLLEGKIEMPNIKIPANEIYNQRDT